ncbi:MAG: amidohydrolase [Desulfovibrio sp.]
MQTLYYNAAIRSMKPGQALFEAMAVADGVVVALGRGSELDALTRQGYRPVDLGGACVLPGFIDCHAHLLMSGVMGISCDLAGAAFFEELFERLSQWRAAKPGESVFGFRFDDQATPEQRMPTRQELDRVVPDVPALVMHATCHRCSVNTRGLEHFALPEGLPGLDLDQGNPTGVVRDPGILTHVFPVLFGSVSQDLAEQAFQHAAGAALAAGVTTVQALEGGDFTPGGTQKLALCREALPIRTVLWNQSIRVEEARELGLPRAGGCICADGELDARTAALFEPYADDPNNRGDLYYTREAMDAFVWTAHSQGMQITVHCEAERAIEQVLSAIETAQDRMPRPDARHRIEHVELPTLDQIERMGRAGIIASVQPAFIPAFIAGENLPRMERLFGPARARMLHPYRTMRERGLVLCGGSDSPVTPFAPLTGVAAMCGHVYPEQSIGVEEALAAFTRDAAWGVFEEQRLGTLEPGKRADFVVLSADPCAIDPESIASIQIRQVYRNGELVLQKS